MKPSFLLAAIGVFVCVSGPSIAGPKANLSALDKDYLKATAQSNLEEVQFEPTVRTHASNKQDRQFGEQMKQDHAKANRELKAVAAQTGYALPKIPVRMNAYHEATRAIPGMHGLTTEL